MSTRYYRLLSLLILVTLVGCSGLPFNLGNSFQINKTLPPEGTQIPTISNIPEGMQTLIPTGTEGTAAATQTQGEQFIRIWLPPEFSLEENGIASQLLKARMDKFEAEHPGIRLEVRLKALDEPGGMLDSLIAASAAAPAALPDLVLLPRPLLESAVLKGLLYAYDGMTGIMDDQSWFNYARQLARLNASTYGIPFAGDVMVLVQSLSLPGNAPLSLQATLTRGDVLLYPAADPQALFTLCMYLAERGGLQDEQGRPALENAPLTDILKYEQQANLSGVMPYTLTEYSDDSQVWEALLGNQYPMAVTWASTYLTGHQAEQANLTIAPLPTPDGTPFTLATGWSWALAGQDPARRILSVKLAEYLVDKDFLAEWTQAAGYLPPRVDALQGWQATQSRQVFERISYSAWLMPSADLIATIGPALEQAVMNVLSAQADPQRAAQAAIDQISQP